jgi:hypothetical protein
MRVGLIKKLVLGGVTAFSLIGFASPAAFAWDGGGSGGYGSYNATDYSNSNNYNYGNYGDYGGNYGCNMQQNSYGNDMGWDWDDYGGNNGSYSNGCMNHNHENSYQLSSYSNNNNRCDY